MSRVQPLSHYSPEFRGISELNIIYEAGLDADSRPILVLCADNLPDPKVVDYDLILGFILARLDEFVESDYVLIFFSSPAKFRPSWLWLLQAYRSLDRKYKKNLKALYVLHLTRTYRIIFDLANKMTSPKFARKLHYIASLHELQSQVSISNKFIPRSVVKYEQEEAAKGIAQRRQPPLPERKREERVSLAFGRSLEDLAGIEGVIALGTYVPKVILTLTHHLRAFGFDSEGLFRKSPSSKELRLVKEAFNRGEAVDVSIYCIEVSTALVKVFIRELPNPLISLNTVKDIADLLTSQSSEEQVNLAKSKIRALYNNKPCEASFLKFILAFLRDVSQHSDKNKMTIHNLAVVFTPNLIRFTEEKDVSGKHALDSHHAAIVDANLCMSQMNQGIHLVRWMMTQKDLFI
ncbi:Rho GTPase activation protein [Spinellus fusiger]|nr:Rho GTPase activation protein [Spinellus fusiger]